MSGLLWLSEAQVERLRPFPMIDPNHPRQVWTPC